MAPRLLFLPNEPAGGDILDGQVGPRAAISRMLESGELAAVEVISFLKKSAEVGTKSTQEFIISRIRDFAPDLILWQHVCDFDIDNDFINLCLNAYPRAKIIYHDDDAYGVIVKRINKSVRTLAARAEITFLSGLGDLAALFIRAGSRRICYAPSLFDSTRFGQPWSPAKSERRYDVVMIGSSGRTRLPFIHYPGSGRRKALAQHLRVEYGEKFALYGRGWNGPLKDASPIRYRDQELRIRESRISVNWDHFDHIPFYFSDRLPISLSTGVPHVTSRHAGYEHLIEKCPSIFLADTVQDALDCTRFLLSRSHEDLNAIGSAGQDWVREHLSAEKVFRNLILTACEQLNIA